MNPEHVEKHLDEIRQWQIDHVKNDNARFLAVEDSIKALPTSAQVKEIVHEVFAETLLSVGRGTRATLITMATVVAAVGVISGGFKWLLASIGIGFISK